MTDRETPDSTPADEAELSGAVAEVETEEPVEPEPWTPERVLEWNAYYDLYVVLGVLLLAFLGSSNLITTSTTWAQLRVGRLIAETGGPVTAEPFALVQSGQPWVNIPWLQELASWLVFRTVSGLASDPDPTLLAAKAEQFGAAALVALTALIRALTALALLNIRRSGPGLWWTAICTTIALGVFISPASSGLGGSLLGVSLGGLAGPAVVGPETWGLLFIAVELMLLHWAVNLGRSAWAYALPPLFLLWANVDESFLFGLLILAAAAVGRIVPSSPGIGIGKALAVLAASALACLANPSIHRVYIAAFDPVLNLFAPDSDSIFPEEISFFGSDIRRFLAGGTYRYMVAYYLALVGIGLGSFALNRRRFSLSRLLVFAVAAVLWGVFYRLGSEFALIFAATIALNGQEWYQDQFGTEGRLGTGWAVWSVGGRALTILVVFAAITRGVTGLGAGPLDATFGFGFNPEDFPFESAEFLRGAQIEGNVLNTSANQGDSMIWRAAPIRRPYLDSRRHVYSREFREQHQAIRKALSEDDVETWKPLLDEHNISVVMIQESASPRTYQLLMQSDRWIPFYDDGAVIMFGRSDASAADVAYFESERLDAEALAYRRPKPVPPVTLPPSPRSWLDRVVANASQSRAQPHTEAAARWFRTGLSDAATAIIPDPARCLLAVREARTALSRNPNDTVAFRLLAQAYRNLMLQESALIAGINIAPENATQINQVQAQSNLLRLRFLQRVTSLTYAIQTTPDSSAPAVKAELARIHLELAQLFSEIGYADLASQNLEFVLDPEVASGFEPADRAQLSQELARLKAQVDQVQTEMTDQAIERQAGPYERANIAMAGGAPGLAIEELKEAQLSGINPAVVVPLLVDLYCQTGQPDKAIELLSEADDPSMSPGGAGTSGYRNGLVSFLIGNYPVAIVRWRDDSIQAIKAERAAQALVAGQSSIKGEVKPATSGFLDLPSKVGLQAGWEFDLGMAILEAGESPDFAAEHLTNALTLAPDLPQRPVIAYYLTKLGKPVPAAPAETTEAQPATAPAPEPPAAPQ